MKSTLLILICIVAFGCHNDPKSSPTSTKAIPPMANGDKLRGHIGGARTELKGAKSDIENAKAEATKAGANQVIPPLESADSHVVSSDAQLLAAQQEIELLSGIVETRDQAQLEIIEAHRKELSEKDKTIAERDKKIQNLENEVLRRAKITIGGIGATLVLAGIGCITAFFMLGFVAGLKVGIVCIAVGSTAITMATLLTQIVFWTSVCLGVAALAAVVYGLWHAFHHTPTKTFGVKPVLAST